MKIKLMLCKFVSSVWFVVFFAPIMYCSQLSSCELYRGDVSGSTKTTIQEKPIKAPEPEDDDGDVNLNKNTTQPKPSKQAAKAPEPEDDDNEMGW